MMFLGLGDLLSLHTTLYKELRDHLEAYPRHDIGSVFSNHVWNTIIFLHLFTPLSLDRGLASLHTICCQ